MDLSFIIPIRLESNDRLKNCITSVSYLLNKVPEAKIYIKEVDSESIFETNALPIIKSIAKIDNLNHIFQKSEPNSLFHRTRYINDLFMETTSKVVWHYDVDVLFPETTYFNAYDLIANRGLDFVYPYGCGVYQNAIHYSIEVFDNFIKSNYDLSLLKKSSFRLPATVGFSQVFNRNSYIKFGMMNENFMSWGCEDCELYYRMMCLEYKVGRVWDDVYHLEHSRTFNSHYNNPKFIDNDKLWQWFRKQDKEIIIKYYQEQDYLKERLS
jgi:predicted glycosyltransferase involved in capsule biosynthesis